MACQASMPTQTLPTQCSRAWSSRGRPQQCARAASRTSSSRFCSRGSSARSRSSASSRRPSAEVDLRVEVKAPAIDSSESANGFISSLLDNAVDDVAIDLEYDSEDESPCSAGFSLIYSQVREAQQVLLTDVPAIAEDSEENETFLDCHEELDAGEQSDACESCDFNSDVCSIASDNLDGAVALDEMVADRFVKTTFSDDAISAAVLLEEEEDEHAEVSGESAGCCREFAFDYASQLLDCAFEQSATSCLQEEEDHVDICDDEDTCGDDLAFDYTSLIFGGAFAQVATATAESAHVEDAQQVSRESAVDALEEQDVEQLRLQAQTAFLVGLETGSLTGAFAQVMQKIEATAKNDVSEEMELVKLQAREALSKAVRNGSLSHAFAELAQQTAVVSDREQSLNIEAAKRKVREVLSQRLHSGSLSTVFANVMQKPETTSEIELSEDVEAAKCKAREALSEGLHNGSLSESFAAVMQKTEIAPQMKAAKRSVREALLKGAHTGSLPSALAQVMQKGDVTSENDSVEAMKLEARQALCKGLQSGELSSALSALLHKQQVKTSAVPASVTPLPLASIQREAEASTTSRPSQSSRSRRRVIGGVVRSSAMQQDLGKSTIGQGKEKPRTFCMEFGVESGDENESTLARASSLTRSYDTLGVQMYSLNDEDQPPHVAMNSPSASSAPKISKAWARLHEASTSAMSMDLDERVGSASSKSSCTSLRTPMPSEPFCNMFAAVPLKAGQRKMRTSASLGSLTSAKAKVAPGGLLPMLAPDKRSAESIAWTMQMSKTSSKWRNTGLRGSASMIF